MLFRGRSALCRTGEAWRGSVAARRISHPRAAIKSIVAGFAAPAGAIQAAHGADNTSAPENTASSVECRQAVECLATAWDAKKYLEWSGNCCVLIDATQPFRDVNRGVSSQNPLDTGELETPRLRTTRNQCFNVSRSRCDMQEVSGCNSHQKISPTRRPHANPAYDFTVAGGLGPVQE